MDGVPLTQATVLLRTGHQTMSGLLSLAPAGLPHTLPLAVHGTFTVHDNYFNDVDLRKLNSSTVKSSELFFPRQL